MSRLFILIAIIFNFIQSEEFYFPYTETITLDNGMTLILSPNYDAKLININLSINCGMLDNPNSNPYLGEQVAFDLFWGSDNLHNSIRNPYSQKDFRKLGILHPIPFIHNIYTQQFDNLHRSRFMEDILIKEDIKPLLEMTYNIFAHSTIQKDQPIFLQKLGNFTNKTLSKLFPNVGRTLMINSTDAMREHSLSMLYHDIPAQFYTPSRVATINPKKIMKAWYYKTYAPDNFTLTICGNIDVSYVKKIVQDIYGKWEPRSDDKTPLKIFEKRKGAPKYRFIHTELTPQECQYPITEESIKYSTISFVGDAPVARDPDYFAYHLIGWVLSKGENSMINNSSFNAMVRGLEIETWNNHPRIQVTRITVIAENEKMGQVYDRITGSLYKLVRGGLTQRELDLWKNYITQTHSLVYHSPGHFSDFLQERIGLGFSMQDIENELEKLNSVTLEDISRVAQKYYHPDNFKIAILGNKNDSLELLNQFKNIEFIDLEGNPLPPE